MPKSRGSNSVGSTGFSSGGSGGFSSDGVIAGSAEELSNRISNRLSDAGPILVTMDSQTRGREEQCTVTFNPNGTTAQVESASGHTYQVNHDEGSCNCMDHRMRGATCRHIRATEAARGQILSRQTPPTAGAAQTNTQSSVTTQTQLDHQAEEQRQQMTQGISDDGHFYSDPENEQAFNEALNRARNEPLNYDYENALNGSNITFGLEIEFAGGNANAIARELYDMGICSSPVQQHYHSSSAPGKWKLERDGSVSGGELVSPILTDTPETWRTLEKVCDVAKRHGATIDTRCGGHVHIGMDPLDTARQRWKRFFRTVGGYEPELYRLAGGTEGIVRPGTSIFSRPFSRLASRGINSRQTMDSADDVRSLARQLQPSHDDRYHGINLTNLHEYGRPNTVEFRYFNSSLDHRQLQANVKIANGIMMASEKARIRGEGQTSEFMKKRGNLIKETQIADGLRRGDNSGIRKFVDICFSRKKDKDEVLKVFAKNNWA